MRHSHWLVIALAIGLGLLTARSNLAPESCSRCAQAIQPHLESIFSPPVQMSLPYPTPPVDEEWRKLSAEKRLHNVRARLMPMLAEELDKHGLSLGQPAFIRLFKESRELELWLQSASGWKRFRTYPIAAMSGELGPKLKEGDGQAPEGIYSVTHRSLNPASSYHLSFNIGYPNAYDQHHARSGSYIMIHGAEVSIGCFAMTDPVIEEIYLIVEAALNQGQSLIQVHAFPFRFTEEKCASQLTTTHPWGAFWQELQPIYAHFETHLVPPKVDSLAGRYSLISP
ncbi:hypothetical protein SAMN02745166_01600 [Prosthecobacter debontii]|uniref:L,D-TPase catalytic domain-containing protein n=1 Tax=Prosthecobacter debontii TaxID=48467 RepID=A0A1T4XJD1_9BACT|nr:L,D-transpeptidase family protein [Prosthecobacter debontii]SKA89650.1 hypothetical protein SAMN02745166_01600 [Prosthecobacter debontii]